MTSLLHALLPRSCHQRGLTGRKSGREAAICQSCFRHDRLSVPRGDGLLASFQHPPGAEASSCIASLDRIVRTRRPGCSADDQGRVEDDFPGIGSPLVEALDDGLDGMFGHLRGVLPDGGEIDEG